jgi:hypothetical protein
MSGVILTLFLCGPQGCEETSRAFPQFESCEWVQQIGDAVVERAGPGSWARCEEAT